MTNRLVSFFERLNPLTQRNVFILLSILIVAAASLIIVNYLTIKTLSAVRAYTNGESQYSKGEKGAARHLIMYVNTQDETHWEQFKQELGVTFGDSIARVALSQEDGDLEVIKRGFLQGRNHPDDHDDMIWLFRNFGRISFMANAIATWREADGIIQQEYLLGEEIHTRIQAGHWTLADQEAVIRRINVITGLLTVKERAFSNVLGDASRRINGYLFVANFFFTLTIIGSAIGYGASMIGKIMRSQQELESKNTDLTITNHELDNFVYSASHDLRAPITSLKGLIELANLEDNVAQIKVYLSLMQQSLDKQDQFINDIIDFSKNKRVSLQLQEVSLVELMESALAQHRFMQGAEKIKMHTTFRSDKAYSDPLRLSIVFNNLISNAIKYSDEKKEQSILNVDTYATDTHHVIIVEDNGVGIRSEDQKHIFDMFFVTQNTNKGSGLGLYIVKEAVDKLGGTIAVESEKNAGTKFIVQIPKNHVLSLEAVMQADHANGMP
jgi:signal transduction histidine kinase